MREEIGQLKNYHRRDLERAEQKSLMAEERSASLSGQQEVRVANLEARLQELSDSVGSYDRLRQQDQVAMQKLKDRIAQLDLENQSLQKAHRQQNPSNQGKIRAFGEIGFIYEFLKSLQNLMATTIQTWTFRV